MAIENVVDEIISQAEKQKREIVSEGSKEAWKILDEAAARAKQRDAQLATETERLLAESERMELSSLNIRLHKITLAAKRSILDEFYRQLRQKAEHMDAAKRKRLLHKLIEKAKKEMPDARYAYCNAKDAPLVKDLLSVKHIDCMGGVIVENADGTIRINYTFDLLLEQLKEAHINEIAKKLFG